MEELEDSGDLGCRKWTDGVTVDVAVDLDRKSIGDSDSDWKWLSCQHVVRV